MRRAIGILATHHIWTGVVEDSEVTGTVLIYPEPGQPDPPLRSLPSDELTECIRRQVSALAHDRQIEAVGIGFPGIIRGGVVEDSPNLQQVKGYPLEEALAAALEREGIRAPVAVLNDADAIAAGIAAASGRLGGSVRVWYLGDGIGFGRYPRSEEPWECGHIVVTLDPREQYCGCGGKGHLEGILGHRAMRKRFLDLEPEEVFANARAGDTRCLEFANMWHRALAAATATNVHLEGPGRFYVAGPNSEFLDTQLADRYLREMVRMSPLQGSSFEVLPVWHQLAIVGAAVTALP